MNSLFICLFSLNSGYRMGVLRLSNETFQVRRNKEGKAEMKRKIRRCVSVLAAAAVLISGIQAPVSVQAQVQKQQTGGSRDVQLSADNGTTVTTREEFMDALQQRKSPIIVANFIGIGEAVESDKRMSPIMIPENTVIQGSTPTSAICSRSPIQLEGDGVRFENIELTFDSSDALWSVPHREIFLAGHSLVLDHVDTYLEGGPEFGGTEKELLPTVYAGGFSNTAIGGQASLTVTNSSDKTIFQAIYMGHNEENDNKVPYRGNAVLNLDAKATVRDVVDTSLSSWAEINMNGSENQYANAKKIYGNTNTVLTLNGVSIEDATAEGVGSIVLKNKAFMSTVTEQLQNVTLISGSCLDFNSVTDVQIAGNFAGEANQAERGILVLNPQGKLTIDGNVTGTTQFQTKSRWFPGLLLTDKVYISTGADKGSLQDFVLAQKKIEEGYELRYDEGQWKVFGEPVDSREIGKIDILSAPSKVDLRKIVQKEEGVIPDENVFFEIKWYDENGNVFSDEDVIDYYMFYEMDQVIRVRTDYWESDSEDILDETDWSQDVTLMASEEHPGNYYLQAFDGAKPGDYTFLFCSEYIGDLHTMAEVKALKDIVKAEKKVLFYDQDLQEPEEPGHTHEYQSAVTKEATCTEAGIRTYTCSCGDQYTEEIDAAGHQEVKDPAVEPTETTEGKTEGSHCGVCGEVLKAQESIPALGKPEEPGHRHTYQSAVTKGATCTEAGIRTYTCSCGDQYTEEIDAAGHQEVKDPAVEPTETTEGKTEGSHCGVCGEVLKAQESIPALGKPEEPGHKHTYESTVKKKPTCIEPGVKIFICSCGEKYTEEISALNHRYMEKCIPATMKADGKLQQICGICSDIKSETVIESPRKITWSQTDFTYDGKTKAPTVIIKDRKDRRLISGRDYQINYPAGRKKPGIYTVVLKFCGNYSGSVMETFMIRPQAAFLKKIAAKSRGIQVKWKKQETPIDGYQIQYCTNKDFKGRTAKITAVPKNASAKKILNLKAKKKYYVRIRTYKDVKVNGKNRTLYSDWSGRKTAVAKK